MSINKVFILAAGLGSRMGSLGKSLPKVLWPIFERPMLDLEIEFWKDRGGEEFYINLHHQVEKIQSQSFLHNSKIHLLLEPELLGVGGAIYNLKRNFIDMDKIILSTSDQFFHLEIEEVRKDGENLENYSVFLYSIPTQKWQKHNGIKVNKEDELCDILAPEAIEDTVYPTYSGLSLLDVNSLENKNGPQSFFGTIANYREKKIKVKPIDQFYWDFGTFDRYVNHTEKIWEILIKEESAAESFVNFLVQKGAVNLSQVQGTGYNSENYSIYSIGQGFIIGIGMNQSHLIECLAELKIEPSISRGVVFSGAFHAQSS
ncbi:sugar phosphate nucleotidyltransferase [Bacteriovoracaceae bacterium]|nr:sugar phosphate nucleotidyltransferase [Bacteriovoracaceae bacterium]